MRIADVADHAEPAADVDRLPGFDRRLAEYATVVLPCSRVIDLIPLSHAPDRIAMYQDCMRRGERFPPISVIRLAGRFLVADGHKRFSAYQALGEERILVEVWPLRRWLRDQWRQAIVHARKNARFVRSVFSDPPEAWRLLMSTVLHWRRVAASLISRARGQTR